MNARELEAAWVEHSRCRLFRAAPTFEAGRLVFGAATELADSADGYGQMSRTVTILSAAYLKTVDSQALGYLRRALAAQANGDLALAAVHIAMAGFGTIAQPEAAARRAFLSDHLLRSGATPEMILAAVGLDPGAAASCKYSPSQPRIPAGSGRQSGRWTSEDWPSFFNPRLAGRALVALASWAAEVVEAAPAALSLGILVLSTRPTARDGNGKVPGHKDLEYSWDSNTIRFHVLIDGRWVTLISGRLSGGLYLDANGRPIARALGDTIVADMDALDDARQALPGAVPGQDRRGPKLCPAPIYENQDSWSARARAYQAYVTGLGEEKQAMLNGVSFDGCREADGTMLEAKDNYAFLLDNSGNWQPWVKDPEDPFEQMLTQSNAAALDGRRVEWHASQQSYAIFLERVMKRAGFPNLSVVYDPWPPK